MKPYEIERKIVTRFVNHCLNNEKRLTVSLERGYDTDECLLASTDRKKIIETILSGDECHVFVHEATGPAVVDGCINTPSWVYFVFGNDGWDTISDYTVGLEKLLEPINEFAQKFE